MADKFELKKVYVPLENKFSTANKGVVTIPVKIAGVSDENWQEAEKLARDGWEIVSVIPMTGSWAENVLGHSFTFTSGYTVFFQRRIQ